MCSRACVRACVCARVRAAHFGAGGDSRGGAGEETRTSF